MYKVFIKDKVLKFIENHDFRLVTIDEDRMDDFNRHTIITAVEGGSDVELHGNPNELISFVFVDFELVIAAGGVVVNSREEVLFIYRNGMWDLPKGKLDKGESVAECAIREVEEECSVQGLTIVSELRSTYHTYSQDNTPVLKRTYWYAMSCGESQNLIPQLEEGITKIEWIAPEDFIANYSNQTYQNIIDVVKNYLTVNVEGYNY